MEGRRGKSGSKPAGFSRPDETRLTSKEISYSWIRTALEMGWHPENRRVGLSLEENEDEQ